MGGSLLKGQTGFIPLMACHIDMALFLPGAAIGRLNLEQPAQRLQGRRVIFSKSVGHRVKVQRLGVIGIVGQQLVQQHLRIGKLTRLNKRLSLGQQSDRLLR